MYLNIENKLLVASTIHSKRIFSKTRFSEDDVKKNCLKFTSDIKFLFSMKKYEDKEKQLRMKEI